LAGKLLFSSILASNSAFAEDFNAEKVMKAMKPEERHAYMAGIIEGLAVARYHKDGKKKDGMGCIYDFFYKDKQSFTLILDAFEKYPTYPPGSIIDVLTKRKCGE
jgi:hypothetical protein